FRRCEQPWRAHVARAERQVSVTHREPELTLLAARHSNADHVAYSTVPGGVADVTTYLTRGRRQRVGLPRHDGACERVCIEHRALIEAVVLDGHNARRLEEQCARSARRERAHQLCRQHNAEGAASAQQPERTLEEQEGEVDLCAGRGWG